MTHISNIDFVDEAPCGLLVTTTSGLIVQANAAFCQWTGYTSRELVGVKRLEEVVTRAGKVFLHTQWMPALLAQRSIAEVKLEICDKNGGRVPTLMSALRVSHHGVEYDKVAVMVVAERYKYESEILRAREQAEEGLRAGILASRQLEEAAHRKDEFLATLSHELRNPLAPMRNVLELLHQRRLEDPQVRWSLDVMGRQIRQMTRLVDDLLEVSRLTLGKLELRKEQVDLSGVMLDAVEASRPLMAASSHELTVTLPSTAILLEADPSRLSQIIQNLLNNAAKFTDTGGKVWIGAERAGNEAVISVRDTGKGIAAEHLKEIFEMFAQVSPALEKTVGGLGIGLSMVRTIAQLHGGTVEAHSEGLTRGAEIVIRLPIMSGTSLPAPVASTNASAIVTKRRLVVIDDNEDAAVSLAMILEHEGHEVRTAFRGLDGLQAAEEFDADVMVVDIGLPDINGYEIARRVSQGRTGRMRKLIALTGWGQAQDIADAMAAGFEFHFTKPVDVQALIDAIG